MAISFSNPREIQDIFEKMDVRCAMTYSIQEVWMSVARAVGTVSAQKLAYTSIERFALSYLEDRSTSILLSDLEGADEQLLGSMKGQDGTQNLVYRRERQSGPLPIFGVYVMSNDYVTWAVYKIDMSGLFRKTVRIAMINRNLERRILRCSFEGFIPYCDPDRMMSSLMTAGKIDHLFPKMPQCAPAYSLAHWWLPCRAWQHEMLWNG